MLSDSLLHPYRGNFAERRLLRYLLRKTTTEALRRSFAMSKILLIQTDNQHKRYQNKYKHMKIRIKSLILENAALCDEVAKVQESIAIVKEERKFLLRKLLEYESEMETQAYYRQDSTFTTNGPRAKLKKRRSYDEGKSIS